MNRKHRRVGGSRLACSCGVKASKNEVAAGPDVYICHGSVVNARSQGLIDTTGDRCSFCTRDGRPTWSLGARDLRGWSWRGMSWLETPEPRRRRPVRQG